jgi:hypothetical protein
MALTIASGPLLALACALSLIASAFSHETGASSRAPSDNRPAAYLPLALHAADPTVTEPAVQLLVQPYLGETTRTSAVISWATKDGGASEIRYSLNRSYGKVVPASSSVSDGVHWHSSTATGLTAGSRYYYRVYTAGQDVTPWAEVSFRTAPASSSTDLTFAVLGDSRPWGASKPPSQGAWDVAAELARHTFDLALHVGDIVHSGGVCAGNDSGWQQYIRAYFDVYQASAGHTPFYPAVGNHELNGGSCGYESYTDVYQLRGNAPTGAKEEYYSFDWANAHFVSLDSSQDYTEGSTQHNWLVRDLKSTTQPWIFVFFHYPAYSSGAHGSTDAVQTQLVPVFETYGVDIVFAGHDHQYERTCPIRKGACTTPQAGGVLYFVTGGAGAPLYGAAGDWFTEYGAEVYHFLLVDVQDCRLRVEAFDVEGQTFDSYKLDLCSSGPSRIPNEHRRSLAAPVRPLPVSDVAR